MRNAGKAWIIVATISILFVQSWCCLGAAGPEPAAITSGTSRDPAGPAPAGINDLASVSILSISREAQINVYGLITIEDEYEVRNDGGAPVNSFIILEHEQLFPKTTYREVTLGTGENAAFRVLDTLVDVHYQVLVTLPRPVLPGESCSLEYLHTVAHLMTVVRDGDSQEFTLPVPIYPAAINDVTAATTDFTFPAGTVFMEESIAPTNEDGATLTYSQDNVDAFSTEFTTIVYVYHTPTLLQLDTLTRRIFVDTWGHLKVEERHELQSMGPVSVTTFQFQIPKDATGFEVSDALGGIGGHAVSEANADGKTKNVTMNLQINRAAIGGYTKFVYDIEYNVPLDPNLRSSWFTHEFEVDVYMSRFQYSVFNDTTRVILLGGQEVSRVHPQPDSIENSNEGMVLVFNTPAVSPYHAKTLEVTFRVNPFQVTARLLVFILLLASISTVYVVLRRGISRREKPEMAEEEAIPKRDLRQFIQLFEERNALKLELSKAVENLRRKRMRKKEYNRFLKESNSKIKDIDYEIQPYKDILLDSDKRLVKVVDNLEYLETERSSIRSSIRLLEQRYRRGKLQSRASFERLRDDLQKRIEKINKNIDRAISELKGHLI